MTWEPDPIKIPVLENPVEEGKSFLENVKAQTNAISFCRKYSRQQLRRIQRLNTKYGNKLGRYAYQ